MSFVVPQTTLKRANRWKLVGLLSLLGLCVLVLLSVDDLLVASLIAFVIAYSVGPIVNVLERRGTSRLQATLLVFASMIAVVVITVLCVAPYLSESVVRLQTDMPRFITGVGLHIDEAQAKLRSIAGPLSNFDLTSKVEWQLTQWTHNFFDTVPGFVRTFFTVMLLGPFLAFFMVKDGRVYTRFVLGLAPNNLFETVLSLQHQINFQIGQFVRARLLESSIVGVVTAIGLVIIGFPYALLLGIIAGVTNLIPYLGPILGAGPAFAIALVNGYSPLQMVGLGFVYVIAQLIDAGFLVPLLVAKIVDLHPVTVIVVIIAGAQVMGILGMIISIPVAGMLKVIISTVYRQLIDTRAG